MEPIINNFSLFPNCREVFDENSNSFKEANSVEIAKCCIENCDKDYNLCTKSCNDDINCKNKCISVNKNLCKDVCSLASPELRVNNDFYSCSEEVGCNIKNTFPDLDCVEKNTEEIDRCVKGKWLPYKTNVNEYNDFFNKLPFSLDKIEDGKINMNNVREISTPQPTPQPTPQQTNNKDNTLLYIMYGIVIAIFLASIIVLKIKLN
jgi:hypothetical protein